MYRVSILTVWHWVLVLMNQINQGEQNNVTLELTYSELRETRTKSVILMTCSIIGGDGYTVELSLYRDGDMRASGRDRVYLRRVMTSCDNGVPYVCKAIIGGAEISSNTLTFEMMDNTEKLVAAIVVLGILLIVIVVMNILNVSRTLLKRLRRNKALASKKRVEHTQSIYSNNAFSEDTSVVSSERSDLHYANIDPIIDGPQQIDEERERGDGNDLEEGSEIRVEISAENGHDYEHLHQRAPEAGSVDENYINPRLVQASDTHYYDHLRSASSQ